MRPATPEERALGSPTAVLEPDPIQMPWVQEAFHRAANGESLLAVYRWIRSLPVEARGSRAMPYQAVRKLLASPLYVARPLHGEADVLARPAARWPALVDDATWLQVRERVAQNGECRGKLLDEVVLAAVLPLIETSVSALPELREALERAWAALRKPATLQDELHERQRQHLLREAEQARSRLTKPAILYADGDIDKRGDELLRDK